MAPVSLKGATGAKLGKSKGGAGIYNRKDNSIHCLSLSVKCVAPLLRAMAYVKVRNAGWGASPKCPPPISPLTLTNRTSLMGHPVCRSVHCTQSKLCNEKIKSHFTMVCLQKVFFYGDKLTFLTFFDFAQNF